MVKMEKLSMQAMKQSATKATKSKAMKQSAMNQSMKATKRSHHKKEKRITRIAINPNALGIALGIESFLGLKPVSKPQSSALKPQTPEAPCDVYHVDWHASHIIMLYRGIWFCARCGAYTDGQYKNHSRYLRFRCRGKTMMAAGG